MDLYCHVSKYGVFLWSVGAELVRFLLKKDRDIANWFEGGGLGALSGCWNELAEK